MLTGKIKELGRREGREEKIFKWGRKTLRTRAEGGNGTGSYGGIRGRVICTGSWYPGCGEKNVPEKALTLHSCLGAMYHAE